eukprot:g28939.t1
MLTAFYTQFEQNASSVAIPAPNTPLPSITAANVKSVFLGVNQRKVMGLNGVPGRALRSRADQLVEVFTDNINLSLLQSEVPICYKKTTIIPVPKKTHVMCLNDYRPVALTSIIMKCVERLVTAHINSSLPACLDPLQLAYWQNRSTEDAISLALDSSLEHVDNMDTYVRPQSVKIDAPIKKAQQHLFFLRQLRKFGMSRRTLANFYRCTTECLLPRCIMAWYSNCSAQDHENLQKVVCTAQTITEANLPSLDSIYTFHCRGK